jgi:hypothetical protein
VLTQGASRSAPPPEPMIAVVGPHLRWSGRRGEIVELDVCSSLQEASGQPYFYEDLFWLGQTRTPFGDGYEDRKRARRGAATDGREHFDLGDPQGSPDSSRHRSRAVRKRIASAWLRHLRFQRSLRQPLTR